MPASTIAYGAISAAVEHLDLVAEAFQRLRLLGWYQLRLALGWLPELRQAAQREVPADLVDAHLARYLSSRNRRAVVQEFVGLLSRVRGPALRPAASAHRGPRSR
ncbi:hypothetical protein [Haloechinothrix halophila]|uniref:hypothetical protein n=1 Tax=Haloechinothrix halophila TaxID=1069073 RepID=UPI0012FC62AC|nr:hypothetical protein [Haloechinothrix halophila]